MKWLRDAWSWLQGKWKALPAGKWYFVGVAIVLLLITSVAEGQQRLVAFYIESGNGLVIKCSGALNTDGIYVCAAMHNGQRGYCIPVPEARYSDDIGAYWCTGNQPGNKTYDKALLIEAMIGDMSSSAAELDKTAADWDLKYPPTVALPGG